jgi:glutamate N-acetyltransferase/amino-acid N-acetyltransferase
MSRTFALPAIWKRLSSTSSTGTLTYHSKPLPSKAHLHGPLSDNLFPKGYVATGVHCGVKKTTALDLAVILSTSDRPTSAAASFTRNAFKAAPVLVCQEVLDRNEGRARGLVVNSGCANAVTGKQGISDAWAMVKSTDGLLDPPPSHSQPSTLVMSTGVIGPTLPIGKITSAIEGLKGGPLGSGFEDWEKAARAFMTTDTFPKLRARTFKIRDKEYAIAGIDKGAGMIHPDMGPAAVHHSPSPTSGLHATLLGCIVTDVAVSPTSLQTALDYAIDRSFNSISVDGDMSTNDTVVVFANGAAQPEEKEIDQETDWEGYEVFRDELTSFAQELAQLVVWDGEGATKFVTVNVEVRV